ncbi:DUF3304 domain-containing protein [Salmonella enterica]
MMQDISARCGILRDNAMGINLYIKAITGTFLIAALIISACSRTTHTPSSAANLSGINHIAKQSVNWFTVNGYGGTLKGNTCCIMLPDKWRPGLKARIEWEVDPDVNESIPMKKKGFGYDEKAYAKHAAKYQHYSTVIDIPQYD